MFSCHITARPVAFIGDENAGCAPAFIERSTHMIPRRNRFKQTTTLKDRLALFAGRAREEADKAESGPVKDALLKKARLADTAAHLDDWANSLGLQPPK
jgi:hypothetical protein